MASDKQSVYDSTVALTPVEATNLAENIGFKNAPFFLLCPVSVPVLALH